MKKKSLLIIIILLAIGFAAVSTTLFINGKTKVATLSNDFDVYYSNAKINGIEDKTLIANDKEIIFYEELKEMNEIYELEYFITNGSKQYDADVTISCTESTDYLLISNSWTAHTIIEAKETLSGLLNVSLKKSYAGDSELRTEIKCTIFAKAIEKDFLNNDKAPDKIINNTSYGLNGILVDKNNKELTNGAVALYSTPMYSNLGNDGYISFNNIEVGSHNLCYVENKTADEIKNLTKEEVMELSKFCMSFTTQDKTISTNEGYKIINLELGKMIDINLNVNGGKLDIDKFSINSASTYGNIPIPTKRGAQFIGWYANEKMITNETKYKDIKSNELKAIWLNNKYSVDIEGINLSLNKNNIEVEYEGNETVTLTPNDGYYLSEFNCTNGYVTNAIIGHAATSTQNITIYNNGNIGSSSCIAKAELLTYSASYVTQNSYYNGTISNNGWTANYSNGTMTSCTYNNYNACTDSSCSTIGLNGCIGSTNTDYYYSYRTSSKKNATRYCWDAADAPHLCYSSKDSCQYGITCATNDHGSSYVKRSCYSETYTVTSYSNYYTSKGAGLNQFKCDEGFFADTTSGQLICYKYICPNGGTLSGTTCYN